MKSSYAFLFATSLVVTGPGHLGAADVDFNRQVKPILESACLSCHGADKPKGGLSLIDKASSFKGGDNGAAIVAGQSGKSPLYTSTVLPPDHDDIMPPKGDTLSKEQANVLKQWIDQGAKWPEGVKLQQQRRVSFVKDIQPILEFNCVACHRADYSKGGLKLDTKESAFTSGDSGPSIIPFHPEKSGSYTTTILSAEDDALMPPNAKGGPLPKDKTDFLKDWISQGAPWPDGLKLTPKKAEEAGAEEGAIVAELYKKIMATHKEKAQADMKEYSNLIPGTQVQYSMLPIPAGKFKMGSPATEKGRKADEGPVHEVAIEPFWMGKFEVTWNEYELFMYPDESMRVVAGPGVTGEKLIDAVSRPTKPYVEMSFGMGKDGYPAISMTQHAANKYCQWLSSRTGHFYRLPTEAEWEYACRAGTTTAYSFGDDAAQIKDHAWFEGNSNFKYQKVGKKKPNPWGLFDMHGNVAEWCLDEYLPDYSMFKDPVTHSPYVKQTKPYPHVARGGSWDDSPALLRSAARRASSAAWKQQDPQLPKSIWYHTDAQFLGFRIVRPLKVPTQEEMFKYWNNGVEKD
ncbi:MAG: SUMF1/EgtB/PvdO family nonheme iron enzyme [Verrucomicrobiota bacterium]